MKIFEALSGVDEELLERSEEAERVTEGKQTEHKVIPFWRYGKAIAACFCLALVGGAVYVSTTLLSPKGYPADSAAPNYEGIAAMEEDIQQDAAGAAQQQEVAPKEGGVVADLQGDMNQEEAEEVPEAIEEAEVTYEKEDVIQNQEAYKDKSDSINAVSEQETDTKLEDAQIEICEEAPYEPITEEEAMETEKFGVYIPTALPTGYRFESAYRIEEDGVTKGLHLCWLKGLDYIDITIRDVGDELNSDSGQNVYSIADISRPETYDTHLYEIPYADTVPQEYWQTFDHPIFREEDFTLDIVKARMKSIEDRGDTDTPRGMFGVLYEDGILVEFSGRGSVEEVWNLFDSIDIDTKD